MKSPLTLAVIWFALLCGIFVFRDPMVEVLSFLYLPVRWGILLAGVFIAGMAIATAKQNQIRSISAFALCALGIWLFFSIGFDCGRIVLFQIRKPTYEQQLEDAIAAGSVPRNQGVTENGPPKLFAFYWLRGVVDNWSGVVFDPTGRIEKINEADGWDEIHSHELSGLFGGTFYRCQNVGGGWYICWFT